MPGKILHIAAFTFLLPACSLLAQTTPPAQGTSPSGTAHTRQEPCWQQAGITKSVFEQHQEILHDTHSQVSAVCADTSLSPQQKVDRAKEIREQARQKTDGLITADQQKAVTACRQQRGINHPDIFEHQEMENPCAQGGRRGARNGAAGNPNGNSPSGSSSPQD